MTSTLAGLLNPEVRAKAEEQATAILRQYWVEGTVPVDPSVIARRMGVEVFSAQLGNDVFGLIVGTPGSAQIYVDEDQPLVRFRFTIAHELGHYVEHGARVDEDELDFVDRRSDDDRFNPHEVHANHFAGALLMPKVKIEKWRGEGLDRYSMAAHCNVSPSALQNRLARMVK